jgi:hypothetical protein
MNAQTKKVLSAVLIPFLIGLLISIFVMWVSDVHSSHKNEYKLNWEKIVDSKGYISPIYRARIYGGWLVKSHQSMIFISLNHPENWILEK